MYGNNAVACRLPERIRPTVLAFGGVADGFVPFDVPSPTASQQASNDRNNSTLEHLANGKASKDGDVSTHDSHDSHGGQNAASGVSAGNGSRSHTDGASAGEASNGVWPTAGSQAAESSERSIEEVELQLASIVMKAVQVCLSVSASLQGLCCIPATRPQTLELLHKP